MTRIEKQLEIEKEHIDEMVAPPDLEGRLRKALDGVRMPARKRAIWKYAAVAILLFSLIGYQFNAVAYYGKKILGFDDYITGTLKDLNESGKGQSVEKTYQLDEDTKITVNGLMADENRLIIYYTLTNLNGVEEAYNNLFKPKKVTGLFTNAMYEGGSAIINEAGTEMKGSMDFEPPSPFSRKLTLHFWQGVYNGQMKEAKFTFPYNPNEAMQTQIKQSIKKTIEVDKGTITFNSIVASPTLTVIRGSLNVENYDRVPLALHGIELLANGKSVEIKGSGSGGMTLKGHTKFDIRFDALPEQLQSLEIDMKKFVGYRNIEGAVSLKQIDHDPIDLGGQELWIRNVSQTSNGLEVTIATDEAIMLDDVSVGNKEVQTPLKTTIKQTYVKVKDGKMLKVRTLVFETSENLETLFIGGIHYMKPYNQKIEISLD